MYFSEFTLRLIDEVKSREILYNTKYDKRPKQEKEDAWLEVATALNGDAQKCKKHWKNIRDRFVKIMHQRDRHFFLGGNEVDAPQYIYFDKLLFMREYSVKKDPKAILSVPSESDTANPDGTPERLLYTEARNKDGSDFQIETDYTEQFLELVKEFPVLYDEFAELKRYRAKDAWKQISNALGKFTVGKLRAFWAKLMRQYKLNLEKSNSDELTKPEIFRKMSFVDVGIVSRPKNPDYIRQLEDEYSNSQEYFEDLTDEEHLVCEEVDGEFVDNDECDYDYEDSPQADECVEGFDIEAPEPKRIKIEPAKSSVPPQSQPTEVCNPLNVPQPVIPPPQLPAPAVPDEFDYFGKKVALQIRELSQKSRSLARKGEIMVLQLLMELEESLETQ